MLIVETCEAMVVVLRGGHLRGYNLAWHFFFLGLLTPGGAAAPPDPPVCLCVVRKKKLVESLKIQRTLFLRIDPEIKSISVTRSYVGCG